MSDVPEQELDALQQRSHNFDLVPPGWRRVERDPGVMSRRTKPTLSLDEDVVRCLRGLLQHEHGNFELVTDRLPYLHYIDAAW